MCMYVYLITRYEQKYFDNDHYYPAFTDREKIPIFA